MLEAMKAVKPVTGKLYEALTAEQKKIADGLIGLDCSAMCSNKGLRNRPDNSRRSSNLRLVRSLAAPPRPSLQALETSMSYYFSKTIKMPFAQAIQHVTDALASKGFGVLTTIDVRATMKKEAQRRVSSVHDPWRVQSTICA